MNFKLYIEQLIINSTNRFYRLLYTSQLHYVVVA